MHALQHVSHILRQRRHIRLCGLRNRRTGSSGHSNKTGRFTCAWVVSLPHNPTTIVNVVGVDQIQRSTRDGVQVDDRPVVPEDRTAAIRADGLPDHLAQIIDRVREAQAVAWKSAEVLNARLGPESRMDIALCILGKSGDLSVTIDRGRRVPRITTEVANVNGLPVLPKYGMLSTHIADCDFANDRDPYHLTSVIDRCRSAVGIPGQWRQRLHLPLSRAPNDSFELQDLWTDAGRVVVVRFSPAYDLASAVGPRGVSVISAKRREWTHDTVLPNESETGVSRRGHERGATPGFP